MTASDQLATAIAGALSPVLGAVEIRELGRLSAGASRETWSCDAIDADGTTHPVVLQRDRFGASGGSCAREGHLLGAAALAGVPVPQVLASGRGPDDLGDSWSITRRLGGESLGKRLVVDERFQRARQVFVDQCASALAAVHAIPASAVEGVLAPVDDPVGSLRSLYDSLSDRHPVFELALRWLDRTRPDPGDVTVVHGDFRVGNLLVDEDGLVAVLDWELSHLGDPIEDLGWLCVRAWRFGGPGAVGGIGSRADLIAAYGRASGREVPESHLHWWEVLGSLKWGLTTLVLGSQFRGPDDDLELASIGRRVAETEYDLMLLLVPELAPDGVHLPDDEADAEASAHDPPTAAVLLDAVRRHLSADVSARSSGRDRFLARVAANLIGIAERELVLGPIQDAGHRVRLATFGVASDAEWGAAIRSGDLDDRLDQVAAELFARSLDKLAVANPRYRDRSVEPTRS
ncbi:MAG: phosphotransferase family protein [Acidimicrobiales bacterium]